MAALMRLLLAVVVVAAGWPGAEALSIRVRPNTEECYMERVSTGEKVLLQYLVGAGGNLDINIRVTDPTGQIVFEQDRQTEGSVSFVGSTDGTYRFCFSNIMSAITAKDMTFNIYVGSALVAHGVAKQEHFSPLESAVVSLAEGLRKVRNEQKYIRFRERACRSTADSTTTRVFWFNVVEIIALVAVGAWQTYYVRSMFDGPKR